jgi:hypothetical protein
MEKITPYFDTYRVKYIGLLKPVEEFSKAIPGIFLPDHPLW